MDVGVRVIRGPSWKWDDQDGGFVGTVVKPFESSVNAVHSGTVFVQWDNGFIGNYRVGKDGEYDLRIFDSGPAGIRFPSVTCDECGQKGIIGTRWKCAVCDNYDLCYACYHGNKHDLTHQFLRCDSLSAKRIEVPSRANSEKSEVLGIFPGATVVRRVEDWLHGQNDGGMDGMLGTVLEEPLLNSNRGSVMVLWENGYTMQHSCGNDGKVALKCVIAAVGKEYYVQHLADLVADQFTVAVEEFMRFKKDENESPPPEASGESEGQHCQIIDPPIDASDEGIERYILPPFRAGDRVQVKMDACAFRALRDDQQGRWTAEMEQCIGATGVVSRVCSGKIMVQYEGFTNILTIRPEALTKKLFDVGDRVKILPDEKRVKSLQKGHGGWVQKMKEDLGKEAEVVGTSNGRVFVKVGSRPYSWTLNANCCTRVECNSETGSQEDSDSDTDSDSEMSAELMNAVLSHRSDLIRPERLVEFSIKSKVQLVKAIVEKYPHMVDIKKEGMTALHVSCVKGNLATVKILLDAGADIRATDNEGNTPVHYSVIGKDDPGVLEVLLERDAAYVDHIDLRLMSVLHWAVRQQNPRCVQALIQHDCNVNVQDESGDTPLHDAISVGQTVVIEALANCSRFDFSVMNDRGFNVLQLAAFMGDSFAVEQLLKQAQHLVNDQQADGITALHIACINGHKDTADILISKGNASTEVKYREQHTPLMIALSHLKVSTMELLIMKGANPNTCDGDGDTCLHLILMEREEGRELPTVDLYDAPEIASIVTQLPPGIREPTWGGVALFLVQHGADIYQQNNSGISPLQLIFDQKVTDILLEAQQRFQRHVNPQGKDPVIPTQLDSVYPE